MNTMEQRDINYIIEAHRDCARKASKGYRKWDGKTPYHTHPIWCATMLATETSLPAEIRLEGIQALIYHDILEDTTRPLPDWLSSRVAQLIEQMTFHGGSSQEMQEIWSKPGEVRLYKLYDKVSNLLDGSWMDEKKRGAYESYTRRLIEEVERSYGILNITRIGRAIVKQ